MLFSEPNKSTANPRMFSRVGITRTSGRAVEIGKPNLSVRATVCEFRAHVASAGKREIRKPVLRSFGPLGLNIVGRAVHISRTPCGGRRLSIDVSRRYRVSVATQPCVCIVRGRVRIPYAPLNNVRVGHFDLSRVSTTIV